MRNAFLTVGNLIDDTGAARATTPAGNGTVSVDDDQDTGEHYGGVREYVGVVGGVRRPVHAGDATGGTAPTDTLSAMLDIARNPGRNVSALYGLVTAKASFQPSLTAIPSDLTLSIAYTGGGLNKGELLAVDGQGNIWVPNAVDPDYQRVLPDGRGAESDYGVCGWRVDDPESLAIDLNGNVWSANEGNGSVSEHTPGGTALSGATGFTVPGMEYPYDIAIDGANNIFTANGNNTVSKISSAGTPVGLFKGAGMDAPYALAIDGSENAWVANADDLRSRTLSRS